jgi:hypothetical protein
MSRQRKRRSKALPVLGAAGLSLSLATNASAAIGGLNPDTVSQQVMLYEEEIADVSLATFRVFDKEEPAFTSRGHGQRTNTNLTTPLARPGEVDRNPEGYWR